MNMLPLQQGDAELVGQDLGGLGFVMRSDVNELRADESSEDIASSIPTDSSHTSAILTT